jgi:hypothetical protein
LVVQRRNVRSARSLSGTNEAEWESFSLIN